MAFKGLADYLETLDAHGELARVSVPVDTDLELAEITRRIAGNAGPALLFEKVAAGSIAVAANLFGNTARACLALGVESLDDLTGRLEAAIAEHTPQNWFDRLKLGGAETGLDRLRPKPVKQAPCQQVVHLGRDVDLAAFPLPRVLPEDLGPTLTAGLCVTPSLDSSQRGVTRLPLLASGVNQLLATDDGNSSFAEHRQQYLSAGQPMPVAVVLGGDPALVPLAGLMLPRSVDLWHLNGILRGQPLEVIKCRTNELLVPAGAELIIEGYVEPGASDRRCCTLTVSAVTQRTRAILPAIIPHAATGDVATLTKVRERALLPQLRNDCANIVDLGLPPFGGPHAFAVLAIRDATPALTRQVAAMVWGSDALRFTRFLTVVDADVDVHDTRQVLAAIGAHVSPGRDVLEFDGPASFADRVLTGPGLARRIALDATRKPSTEAPPPAARAHHETLRLVTARWSEYGLPGEASGAPRLELPV